MNFLYNGTYTVSVKDQAGCTKNYTLSIGCVTGIEEYFLGNTKIYPNPTSQFLYLESDMVKNLNELNITILNSLGQKMLPRSYYTLNNKILIDVSDIADGVYILLLMDKENTVLKNIKFIKSIHK
ncbi:MAG: hypothetical protein KatS3mg027_1474 [Bacteroidia bacterium]|nr:MAG: hypothetical protein KatS3mg027_1474 [Bacteroidia bacterium]